MQPERVEGTWGNAEAARFLGCTEGTLRKWASQRRVPHVKLGRKVRFLPADLRAFVSSHRVEVEG